MLRYHVAFYIPQAAGEMVVAEALDFPGAGFDRAGSALCPRWDFKRVKRHELIGHLQRQGCYLEREGAAARGD
jgi:hypothetical protein